MSLLKGARTMAAGTVASRATGFLRTAVLAAVLGVKGVAAAFNLANTAPNIVYELLLGGILTSVLVPLLVRAHHEGDGEAFAQRLLTLALLVLGGLSVLLVLFAPQIVAIYASPKLSHQDRALAVTFARFFLPQILFYGLGALAGAYLNTKGRFGPPMWAPVLNNLVVIVTGLVFALLPGAPALTSASITQAQLVVLAVGVTLGVVAQTVVLLPALRSAGLRVTVRFDLRGTGLAPAARLARWTFLYVLCNQLVYVVVVRLATGTGDYPSYVYAFLLWQLPHAVVAVSIITAFLPSMSQAAVEGRTADLRRQLDQGLRLTIGLLVPAAAGYIVLGRPLAAVVFAHGRTSTADARFIGTLLAVFACGLVAFSTYQLQLRAFYAQGDTRTPALVNLAINAATVVVDVALYLALPADVKVLGLAAGQAASYLLGVGLCSRVLARSVARDPQGHVLRTAVRCLFAVALPAGAALGVSLTVQSALGTGQLSSALAVLCGGALLLAGYLPAARRLAVPEVDELVQPVTSRLRGVIPGGGGGSRTMPDPPNPQG